MNKKAGIDKNPSFITYLLRISVVTRTKSRPIRPFNAQVAIACLVHSKEIIVTSRRFVVALFVIYDLPILLPAGSEAISIALPLRIGVVPWTVTIATVALGVVDLLVDNLAIVCLAPLLKEGKKTIHVMLILDETVGNLFGVSELTL